MQPTGYISTCLKMFDGNVHLKSHRNVNHERPNKLYHLYRLPTVSRRASDTWILCLKPMKWKFSRSAPLTMRLHCVFIYTRHQTPPAECEPKKSSLLLLGFVENKTQQFSKDLCSPFFRFLFLRSQWFSCPPPLRPRSKHSLAMGFSH